MTAHGGRGSWASRFSTAGLGVVAVAHIGYPLAVRLAARRSAAGNSTSASDRSLPTPMLSVIIPAYDEAPFIVRKLQDTLAQDYPCDRLEIVVVDDGSIDGTAAAARSVGDSRVRVIVQQERSGKSAALNRGVQDAVGEIIVFTDANGSLDAGSLRAVVAAFDHPKVAVVSGRKRPIGDGAHGSGESMYWRYESALKDAEGILGSVVGADGGIYAVRKSLYQPIPGGIYADDYWIPISSLSRGLMVRHAMGACATESISHTKRDDFERRKRIAAGVWQVTLSHPHLAQPRHGWTAVAFVCHRFLRTLVVPWLLPVILIASWFAGRGGNKWMRSLFAAQACAWSAAGIGAVSDVKVFAVPYQFGMANTAAIFGGYRHLGRRQSGLWRRTERGQWHESGMDELIVQHPAGSG
ncbi:MAG: glycosyltransferase family 2 protein [Nakamurella sp.]